MSFYRVNDQRDVKNKYESTETQRGQNKIGTIVNMREGTDHEPIAPKQPGTQNDSHYPDYPVQAAAHPLAVPRSKSFHHDGAIAPTHQGGGHSHQRQHQIAQSQQFRVFQHKRNARWDYDDAQQ